MVTRRAFLAGLGLTPPLAGRVAAVDWAARLAAVDGDVATIAQDEDFWFQVQREFAVDRARMNFNNGGVSPSPSFVLDALKRHLDFANQAPAYNMWRLQEPNKEAVRAALARTWKCDPEELAIVRNASEGLEILQFGFDLERGDEVLCTTQDYPRMVNAWKQRELRDGVVLKQFEIPTPCTDPARVVELYRQNITERTKLIMVCHMINLTGQVLPVSEITKLGRERGIPVLVDGAHAFAHLDFDFAELDVDYYATSLHKWLFAPIGTGLLYVRRELIPRVWSLLAMNDGQGEDIRKFEQFGTHPVGNFLAIAEALTFHHGIGGARKLARMLYLRDRWAKRLAEHDRIRLNTSLALGDAGGFANVGIDGIATRDLGRWLQNEHRIITTSIVHDEFEGLRVSPSVYATLDEVDRFADAMEHAVRHGLPA